MPHTESLGYRHVDVAFYTHVPREGVGRVRIFDRPRSTGPLGTWIKYSRYKNKVDVSIAFRISEFGAEAASKEETYFTTDFTRISLKFFNKWSHKKCVMYSSTTLMNF